MSEPIKIAVVGVGRMGPIHALHLQELAQETGRCAVATLVDVDIERARRCADKMGCDVPILASIDELIHAGIGRASCRERVYVLV